jgi:formamidopyrimidine-DNA glycosylase
MPELPEVEVTRLGVDAQFSGLALTGIDIRQPMLRWPVPAVIQSVVGQVMQGTARRSKYLMLNFQTGSILVHLGMSGALRVVASSSPWQLHEHIQWRFGDRAFRLHDPRRFGSVDFLPAGADPATHPRLKSLGVEPLSDEFSALHLYLASRGRQVSCKAFLLAGHAVVGVGNIYASESLFRAGIRPGRAAGRLSRPDCERLAAAIRDVLSEAVAAGGSSLRDFSGVSGELGHFQTRALVYDRDGEPCRRCKTAIRRIVQNQRSSFYCPVCQPR